MSCNLQNAPAYLHWNNRVILTDTDFLSEHHLYRIKKGNNPIEYPPGISTSLSCKWSHLINDIIDIFKVNEPSLGDKYEYAVVSDIRAIKLPKDRLDEPNKGYHALSCVFVHKPEPCDYSHCEIDIIHSIYTDATETNLVHQEHCTYERWMNGDPILCSDAKFYKNFRKDYRVEVIKKFKNP